MREHRDELAAAVVDPTVDPRIRIAALGALVRSGTRADARRAWIAATGDPDPAARRRAAEHAPALGSAPIGRLLALVADADDLVAEAACFALGEIDWTGTARTRAVTALIAAARHHDPLVREAAVAALGAIGDERGRDAVLRACTDRPAIRRRAVLALAPFAGPEVDAALERALEDPDWQTRQAAEDLL